MEPGKVVVILGEQERVGDWIILDPEMTKVLSSASTPEEALRLAGIDPHGPPKEPRPIVMQVQDPSLLCLY